MRTDRVQETIKEWETKVNDASERIAEYERLKLSVDRLQALHASLLSLLQSVDVSHNLDQENITILDRPSEATNAKKSALVAAFLLFLGLGAGLGLVFLVEQSDDRVRSLEELTGRFDEWVVGQVPEVPKARKKKRPALLEANDGRHAFAESHRNLRSALAFATGFNGEEKPKLLLVTSAIPNEGKSTVAANLARTLAFAGARVLLVDGDMRRGVLHQLFGLPQEPGLSDLLSDGGDLAKSVKDIPLAPVNGTPRPPPSSAVASAKAEHSALRPLTSGQLHLLPRGRLVDTPGELLLGPTAAGCWNASARNTTASSSTASPSSPPTTPPAWRPNWMASSSSSAAPLPAPTPPGAPWNSFTNDRPKSWASSSTAPTAKPNPISTTNMPAITKTRKPDHGPLTSDPRPLTSDPQTPGQGWRLPSPGGGRTLSGK